MGPLNLKPLHFSDVKEHYLIEKPHQIEGPPIDSPFQYDICLAVPDFKVILSSKSEYRKHLEMFTLPK